MNFLILYMYCVVLFMYLWFCPSVSGIPCGFPSSYMLSFLYEYVTGYGKRAHFAQELNFQNKQVKYVTPLDFVHNSDSLKCYTFSQKYQIFML